MENLIPILLKNIYGYDIIIFIVAVINLFVYFFTTSRARRLYDALHPTARAKNSLNEAKVVDMRKSVTSAYATYVNITAIFPLLGILGTVLSLLNMTGDMSNVQTNFFAALTSTFWGLIFAIFYKLIDSKPAALIEDNEKNVAFYLERSTKKPLKVQNKESMNKESLCTAEEGK